MFQCPRISPQTSSRQRSLPLAFVVALLAAALIGLGCMAGPISSVSAQVLPAASDPLEKQARLAGDALIPSCAFDGARCGYLDQAGHTVVEPQFDWADRVVDGRALVVTDGKYGVLDEAGKLVVPLSYDGMSAFSRGMAMVLVGDRLGVVDRDGQWIVPAEHGAVLRISDDIFLVAQPPYQYPGRQGRLDALSSQSQPFAYGKLWGIVAAGGAWIVRPKFQEVAAFSDAPGAFFWAGDSFGSRPQWTLMRAADGSPAMDQVFDHVQAIPSGQDRAVVQRANRWGALDGQGHMVIELKFDWLGYFRDGWAPFKLAGHEGRLDAAGNILSDQSKQPSASDSNAKMAAEVGDTPIYTDRSGTVLLGTNHPVCPDGRHLRFSGGAWTIVSRDEQPHPAVTFQYVHLECDGNSVASKDGKWGFISPDGKLVAGRYFDRIDRFHNGIAVVRDAGLWGVIREDGTYLLGPLKLARRTTVSATGEYAIQLESGYVTLDKARVAELARDPDVLTHSLPPRYGMSEGLAGAVDTDTRKWGFVDHTGKFVIAPRFDALGSFRRGVAWAAFPERRQWCLIDKHGGITSENTCHCGQPLVFDARRPPAGTCYEDGVALVLSVVVNRRGAD